MAKENVKKFYEEITKNSDLQEKLTQAQENYSGDKEDRDALVKELLIPFAKECGYEFTAEEVLAVDKERAIEAGAVSEEELENVSGGWTVCMVGGGATYHSACIFIGAGGNSEDDLKDKSVGVGVHICIYAGIGVGVNWDV